MMDSQLQSPYGSFVVKRFPTRHPKSLRAWDAADEYLLNHAAEHLHADIKQLLIVNDMFGALSVALHRYQITCVADAYVSARALALNYQLNHIDASKLRFLYNLEELPQDYCPDAVLMKLPKDLTYFKAQLGAIARHLKNATPVIAAGMVKHMDRSYSEALEHYIGPTTASLAKKKARLLTAGFCSPGQKHYSQTARYQSPLNGLQMINVPNTFSYGQFDPGARLLVTHMLQHPPRLDRHSHIIDLGCGDGILGLTAAGLFPDAQIWFTDNSSAALRSARASAAENFDDRGRFHFLLADCLSGYDGPKADWIVCNPPFHQEYTISTHVAEQMFRQAKSCLAADGTLWIIANRHLRYKPFLQRLFDQLRTIASDDKFLIFEAKVISQAKK